MSNDKAILYRDADYGALAVVKRPQGILATYDHGLAVGDFARVLEVLERGAHDAGVAEDGAALWKLSAHPEAVLANIETALQERGYARDPLGARAIVTVPETEARKPDLPVARETRLSEVVDRGLRRHADLVLAQLGTFGKVESAETAFFPRPSAVDSLRRPLPFLRVRGILATTETAKRCSDSLREALAPLSTSVIRATVEEAAPGKLMVEFAVAPTAAAVDAFLAEQLPSFGESSFDGSRYVRFLLNALMPADRLAQVEEQARACTAVLSLTAPDVRTVEARIPSANVADPVMDAGFRDRLAWLAQKLEAFDAEIQEIGAVEEMTIPTPPPAPAPAKLMPVQDAVQVREGVVIHKTGEREKVGIDWFIANFKNITSFEAKTKTGVGFGITMALLTHLHDGTIHEEDWGDPANAWNYLSDVKPLRGFTINWFGLKRHVGDPYISPEAAQEKASGAHPQDTAEEAEARVELEQVYGDDVYNTTELQQHFVVHGFSAPFVVVTRNSDGKKGSLQFRSRPRLYFKFVQDD